MPKRVKEKMKNWRRLKAEADLSSEQRTASTKQNLSLEESK